MRVASLVALMLLMSPRVGWARPVAYDTSIGIGGEGLYWFAGTSWRHEISATLHASPTGSGALPLEVVAGLRVAPDVPVDLPATVFAGISLAARAGRQEPTAGLELGASGLVHAEPARGAPPGASEIQNDRVSPFYVAATASPFRFRFGRWRVSAADFRIGGDLSGSTVSCGVTYGALAYRW